MFLHERIFVALDTNDVTTARSLVGALKGKVGGFKIGLEIITAIFVQLARLDLNEALGLLKNLRALFDDIGEDLFWDGKFDDIPNTVAGAALGLAPLSPKFFNVHASSGVGYKEKVSSVEEAVKHRGKSKVLAVTLLTSFDDRMCMNFFNARPETIVVEWAKLAVGAGVDGLICSSTDLEWVNADEKLSHVPKMVPGIRPTWSEKADQSRIMTPAKALKAGATWMVIGRPITQYPEGPWKAVERILDEMATLV
jgi:orotidine-5'-phosphate decarboxylase